MEQAQTGDEKTQKNESEEMASLRAAAEAGDTAAQRKIEKMESPDSRGPVEVANDRLQRAADAGQAVFEKMGNFFRSSWKGSKAEKITPYLIAPETIISKKREKGHFTTLDLNKEPADVANKYAKPGQSWMEKASDYLLKKYAEEVGLRDKMNIPQLGTPEAKNTILGLSDEKRSMGGELIVGQSILGKMKVFYDKIQEINSRYEMQQRAMLERRQKWLEQSMEKAVNLTTAKELSKGIARKRAETGYESPKAVLKRLEKEEQEKAMERNKTITAGLGIKEAPSLSDKERAEIEKEYEGMFRKQELEKIIAKSTKENPLMVKSYREVLDLEEEYRRLGGEVEIKNINFEIARQEGRMEVVSGAKNPMEEQAAA